MTKLTRTTSDFSPALVPRGGDSSFKQSVANFFLCSLSNGWSKHLQGNTFSCTPKKDSFASYMHKTQL